MKRWVRLIATAAAATALLALTSDLGAHLLPLHFANRGSDIAAVHAAARALVTGSGADPYTLTPPLFYPLSHVLLLAPLGWLSLAAAAEVARLLSVAAVVLVVLAWTRWEPSWAGLPLLLSLPVVVLGFLPQLPAALGLVAWSLALLAALRGRWATAGVLGAVGLIRVANAPALVAWLLVLAWRERGLRRLVAGFGAVLVPLLLASLAVRPGWPAEYLRALGGYSYLGPIWASARAGGTVGVAALVLAGVAAAAVIATRGAGYETKLLGAAAVLAISCLTATTPADYAVVFAIPLMLEAARRRQWAWIAIAMVVLPWVTYVALPGSGISPYVLAPAVELGLVAVGLGVAALAGPAIPGAPTAD